MAVINTGLLTAGARSEFFARLEGVRTVYQDLCTRITSDKATEAYRWLGSVPNMRQWVDERQPKGLRNESYDVANLKYEASIEVDRDEIADDQTGQILMRVRELAARAPMHKDYLLAQLLENGGAAGYESYDGVTFFNDAHASGSSGSQDNNLTGAAATGTTPTVDEFKTALKACIAAMASFKDDQGMPTMVSTSGLVVVVDPTNYFTALEAVAQPIASTAARNVLADLAPRVVMFPYLTSTDRFYVLKTDEGMRPFIFQDREPLEFDAIDMSSERGRLTHKLIYGCWARYRITYGYWQYAVRYIFT